MTTFNIHKVIVRVRAIREGGYTQRCHTTPHHGSYSVAEHSWGVTTLLAILHPNPSKDLILAGMWHDVSERWAGDTPAPIKWEMSNNFRQEVKEFAADIENYLGIDHILNLSEKDLKWLKACDMLEFLLWSMDQQALGNCNANEGRSNAEHWFKTQGNEIPKPIRDFIINYKWDRTSDRNGWIS